MTKTGEGGRGNQLMSSSGGVCASLPVNEWARGTRCEGRRGGARGGACVTEPVHDFA